MEVIKIVINGINNAPKLLALKRSTPHMKKGARQDNKIVFSIAGYSRPPHSEESTGTVKAGGIRNSIAKIEIMSLSIRINKHPAIMNFKYQGSKSRCTIRKDLTILFVFKLSITKKVLIARSRHSDNRKTEWFNGISRQIFAKNPKINPAKIIQDEW